MNLLFVFSIPVCPNLLQLESEGDRCWARLGLPRWCSRWCTRAFPRQCGVIPAIDRHDITNLHEVWYRSRIQASSTIVISFFISWFLLYTMTYMKLMFVWLLDSSNLFYQYINEMKLQDRMNKNNSNHFVFFLVPVPETLLWQVITKVSGPRISIALRHVIRTVPFRETEPCSAEWNNQEAQVRKVILCTRMASYALSSSFWHSGKTQQQTVQTWPWVFTNY